MAQDGQTVILALSIAFPLLALASVILRFESRRIKHLKLEADDWTVLTALVSLCALCSDFPLHELTQNIADQYCCYSRPPHWLVMT